MSLPSSPFVVAAGWRLARPRPRTAKGAGMCHSASAPRYREVAKRKSRLGYPNSELQRIVAPVGACNVAVAREPPVSLSRHCLTSRKMPLSRAVCVKFRIASAQSSAAASSSTTRCNSNHRSRTGMVTGKVIGWLVARSSAVACAVISSSTSRSCSKGHLCENGLKARMKARLSERDEAPIVLKGEARRPRPNGSALGNNETIVSLRTTGSSSR